MSSSACQSRRVNGAEDANALVVLDDDGCDLNTKSMSELGSILLGYGLDIDHVRGLDTLEDRSSVVSSARRLRRGEDPEEEEGEEEEYEGGEEDEDGDGSDFDCVFCEEDESPAPPAPEAFAGATDLPTDGERFLLFVRVLMKYLERADPPMHAKCRRTLREHRSVRPFTTSSATAAKFSGRKRPRSECGDLRDEKGVDKDDEAPLRLALRRAAGGVYWKRAVHFLNLFESRHLVNLERRQHAATTAPSRACSARAGVFEEAPASTLAYRYFSSQSLSGSVEGNIGDSESAPSAKKAKVSNGPDDGGDSTSRPTEEPHHHSLPTHAHSNEFDEDASYLDCSPTLQDLLPSNPYEPLPPGSSWSVILRRMNSHPDEVSSYRIDTLPGQILHALATQASPPPSAVILASIRAHPGGVLAETASAGSPLRAACRAGAPLEDVVLPLFRAHVRLAREGRTAVHPLGECWHPDLRPFHVDAFLRDLSRSEELTFRADSADGLGDCPLDDVISCFALRESPLWKSFADWDKLQLLLRASSVPEGGSYEDSLAASFGDYGRSPQEDEEEGEESSFLDMLPAPRFLPVHALLRHVVRPAAASINEGAVPILRFMKTHQPHQFAECDDDGLFPLHVLLSSRCPLPHSPSDGGETSAATAAARELVRVVVESLPAAAREPDPDTGRLPLHAAIENGWPVEDVLAAHPEALSRKEPRMGLFPFQLAAATPSSSVATRSETDALDCAFQLLRRDPTLIADAVRNV